MKSKLQAMEGIKFSRKRVNEYICHLKALASLSKLFSESSSPFLYYRAVENIYCRTFEAKNLGRKDISYDAIIDKNGNKHGIGIKTFILKNNRTTEKIAEFNQQRKIIDQLQGESLIKKIAYLRNKRIDTTNNTYGVKEAIYHCVGRRENTLLFFDTPYEKIDTQNIDDIKEKSTSISFFDGKSHYSYYFSKSTLFKTFQISADANEVEIEILKDPYRILGKLLSEEKAPLKGHLGGRIFPEEKIQHPYVVLPLYSVKDKTVSEKSGVNLWNAGGRDRDSGEVYIPVPKEVHDIFPNFFPKRDKPFKLQVPNGQTLKAKLCQDSEKALMTNPNKALSEWLLQGVFDLKKGELMTYEKLLMAGTDSVRIEKLKDGAFSIDFAPIDAYEEFIESNTNPF